MIKVFIDFKFLKNLNFWGSRCLLCNFVKFLESIDYLYFIMMDFGKKNELLKL